MVAPGTALREGIDNILHAHTGGLIVIGDADELAFLFSGGIKLDLDYSPELLYELAKMDGAIVLSSNATKIAQVNVQLTPDPTILTFETGTRHRTAERVSKQVDAIVIAVSERREVVSLYIDGMKYILEDIPVVLAKANQALATLDKYRSRLDQVSTRLDRARVRGRRHPARRPHGSAAGRAGDADGGRDRALHRRARNRGPADRDAARRDDGRRLGRQGGAGPRLPDRGHRRGFAMAIDQLVRLPHQDLLDFGRLAELLGHDRKLNTLDYPVSPRGFRILGRIPRLPKLVVQRIVDEFGGLEELLAATDGELETVDGVGEIRAKDIREGLRRQQEINLVDRYLQT